MVLFAGKLCIEVSPADKIAFISEDLCIGCGICAKVSSRKSKSRTLDQKSYFIKSFLIVDFLIYLMKSVWTLEMDSTLMPAARTN